MVRLILFHAILLAHGATIVAQAADFAPESIPGTRPGATLQEDPSLEGPDDMWQGEEEERSLGSRPDASLRFDDDSRDAELGLSQAEIRAERQYGVAAILGPANPWMSIGLEGYYTIDGLKSVSLSAGQGNWTMSDRTGQIEYDIDAKSTATMLGFRYHLHDSVPMFITPMIGYGIWKGNLNPSGTNDPNSLSELELLKTGFNVRGMIVGASVGLSANWENGFFLEYALINFSQALPLSKDYTSTSKSAQKQVTRALTRPGSWGLLNLKVGYFF